MAIAEVIKFEGPQDALVWKFPIEDFNATSQLIVDETHEALLVVNGNAADLFTAGRRTLSVPNIPIARTLIEIPTGGNSPFPCKVFFINKVPAMDLLWGTQGPIALEDPLYDIFMHVMANGSMSVSVENSRKFMLKIVGFRDRFTPDDLIAKFRGIISSHVKDCISKIMINGMLSYSKALVVLSSAEFEQFNAQHFDDSQMVRELADNGILVDETFDEIGFMTYCHNMTKFSKGSLHLVLATTMDCNFACPYCYENRRKGKMSIAVQDAIVQFIEANINNGVHKLDVTWYGGEPLLYPDIVESLAARIRSLADRSGCELTMYMVTNGYLFTPDLVELIDRIGVVKVQITLDGLKEHHDSRRHLRDGRGTFDKIVENLRLFEEYAIRVDIRMNVDNENCRDYIGLQQKLAELDNPNVVLYPSPVEDINPDTVNEVSDFMTFDEFEKFAGDICKEGDATSAATKVLDDRYCYCQAETENSYVIDELGNCYKCWDQVGRVETCCFNITSPDKKNYSNIVKFMSWDPFRDEKCGQCVFLPVCFGGCKFHRLNTGKYDCGFTAESMKSYLENEFFSD